MIQAVTTFASVIVAAAIAYLAALAAWRRQQRREVYGAFVAATDDALEAIDALLAEGADAHLRDLSQWEHFRQARHRFDAAWGQVRLVAPASLAEHARNLGFALLEFERDTKDLTLLAYLWAGLFMVMSRWSPAAPAAPAAPLFTVIPLAGRRWRIQAWWRIRGVMEAVAGLLGGHLTRLGVRSVHTRSPDGLSGRPTTGRPNRPEPARWSAEPVPTGALDR